MSDLLIIGASATRAYGAALRTIGENVANADDPAYVRRRLALTEAGTVGVTSPLYVRRYAAHGADIAGVERQVDALVDGYARDTASRARMAGAQADWLARFESDLADGADGIGARMGAMFDAATTLAASPADGPRRLAMLAALGRVTAGFNGAASRLADSRTALDRSAAEALAGVNRDVSALSGINRELRRAVAGSAGEAQLLDRRDALLRGLSAALPMTISYGPRGEAGLTLDGVAVLDGLNATTLSLSVGANGGFAVAVGAAPAAAATGGTLGGLSAAGTALATMAQELDLEAADFATGLNGWQAAGLTPAGSAGPPLLSGSTAATLAVATSNPTAIAAADAGGAANGNLLALGTLRGSGGAEARFDQLAGLIAQQVQSAQADRDAAGLIADAAAQRRDVQSGVDLDREAAEMMRLQQAYDAAARVLQVARETMQSIFAIF